MGPLTFNTKREAHEFVMSYLRNAEPGAIAIADREWVTSLLQLHPRYVVKSADALEIVVMVSDYGQHCFGFRRKDDSLEDIGTKKIFDKSTTTPGSNAYSAFRLCIQPQIEEFRKSTFQAGPVECPLTMLTLHNDKETHIDHHFDVMPFKDLLNEFLKEEDTNLADVDTVSDGTRGRKLKDTELQRRFEAYHKRTAVLRAIARKANLAGPKFSQQPQQSESLSLRMCKLALADNETILKSP